MPQVPPPSRPSLSQAVPLLLRVLAALCLMAGAVLAAAGFGDRLGGGAPLSRAQALLPAGLTTLLVLAGLALLLRGLERRPMAPVLGLAPPARAARAFVVGLRAWLLPATLAVAVAVAAGWATVSVAAAWPQALTLLAAQFVIVLLIEAVPEELVLRGYVGAVLAERLRRWPAIIVQALCFAGLAVLLTGRTDPTDASLFLAMGLVFGYLRELTGTVWTSIGFHVAFQTGMQLFVAGQRGVFSLEAGGMLPLVLLGMVPFAACVALVEVAVALRWLRPVTRDSGSA